MLCAFGHRVPTCCDMLGVVGSNLTKLEPTTANMWQHIATWWPNAHNMLRPAILRYVAIVWLLSWSSNHLMNFERLISPSASYAITKKKNALQTLHLVNWSQIKEPRPNDRNMPTQHIATLLGATCCVRLATLLRHVATCWVLLAQI